MKAKKRPATTGSYPGRWWDVLADDTESVSLGPDVGQRYRCHHCAFVFASWLQAERHINRAGGGRISLVLPEYETEGEAQPK